MSKQTDRPKDASKRGRAIYDKRIRRFIESQPDGIAELIAINVFDFGSANWMDGRSADAAERLRRRSANCWHTLRSLDADSHGG